MNNLPSNDHNRLLPPVFVFVHGSWHGAWAFEAIIESFHDRGRKAIAIDLPGHGEDKTPLEQVTIGSYVDRILKTVNSIDGPVILVAHSMGGMPATAVAEILGERLSALIYLAAFIPISSQSLLELAEQDKNARVFPCLVMSHSKGLSYFSSEFAHEVLFNDCDLNVASYATSKLGPQPMAPYSAKIKITDEGWGRTNKAYIATKLDRAVTYAFQKYMANTSNIKHVYEIESDHSPFLSKTKELTQLILRIEEEIRYNSCNDSAPNFDIDA